MQAAFIEAFGGPDRIRYGELPDPVPVRWEVLTFADAALAHTLMEHGELPRRPDRTAGCLGLKP